MKIECFSQVWVVNTKKKLYWYKRKGYYVGERWVKPKKILKTKSVLLKKPLLFGNITLIVDDILVLNGVYVDENNKKYLCISRINSPNKTSTLRNITLDLEYKFITPTKLHLLSKPIDVYYS